jgi:hypothetical protein
MNHLGAYKKCYWKMSTKTQGGHLSNIIAYYNVHAADKTLGIFFLKFEQQKQRFWNGHLH